MRTEYIPKSTPLSPYQAIETCIVAVIQLFYWDIHFYIAFLLTLQNHILLRKNCSKMGIDGWWGTGEGYSQIKSLFPSTTNVNMNRCEGSIIILTNPFFVFVIVSILCNLHLENSPLTGFGFAHCRMRARHWGSNYTLLNGKQVVWINLWGVRWCYTADTISRILLELKSLRTLGNGCYLMVFEDGFYDMEPIFFVSLVEMINFSSIFIGLHVYTFNQFF